MNDALARLIDIRAIEPIPPELSESVERYAAQGPDIAVTNSETRDSAAEYVRIVKKLESELEDAAKAHKRPLQDAVKELGAEYEKLTTALTVARRAVLSRVDGWNAAVEKARREEQARLDREEAARVARLQARAEREAEKGNTEKAAVIEQQASQPRPRAIAPAPPPPKGLSKREVWSFEYTNRDLVPREYCEPSDTKIGGVVRAMKDKTNIPGIKVTMSETDVIRT